MKKFILIAMLVVLALTMVLPVAAFSNNANANAADGQANAISNCVDTIVRQNGNGQTGSNTGNANDNKQLNTAVTNCDHFWPNNGQNG